MKNLFFALALFGAAGAAHASAVECGTYTTKEGDAEVTHAYECSTAPVNMTDKASLHRSSTQQGARLFIVDGGFLGIQSTAPLWDRFH